MQRAAVSCIIRRNESGPMRGERWRWIVLLRMGRCWRCALALLCALALGLVPFGAGAEDEVDLLTVDHRLYELGYRDAACSGVLDDAMVNALRNFQKANGLGITGQPDPGTVLVLLSNSARSQADYIASVVEENKRVELGVGAGGEDVLELQEALEALGYMPEKADGYFRASTLEAVCRFQLANGLEVTGTADAAVYARLFGESPITWSAFLDGCVASMGESGDKVRLLQRWLSRTGYYEGAYTARYGEATQRAVSAFQCDAALPQSGDADEATVRALYGNARALRTAATTLRRDMAGAQELCEGLSALGYSSHNRFDMQTELALMQFQFANGRAVTGVADGDTLVLLNSPNAVGCAGYVAGGAEAAGNADFPAHLLECAQQLLGEVSGFDDEFALVQYVCLCYGVAVLNRNQLSEVGTQLDEARPGDVLVAEFNGSEHWGLITDDGGLIYRDPSTRIVKVYPRLLGATEFRIYRVGG